MDWIRPPFAMENYIASRSIFRLELPLLGTANIHLGTLILIKDMKNKPIDHLTIRRVEDLRRTIIKALERLEDRNQKTVARCRRTEKKED